MSPRWPAARALARRHCRAATTGAYLRPWAGFNLKGRTFVMIEEQNVPACWHDKGTAGVAPFGRLVTVGERAQNVDGQHEQMAHAELELAGC
jgi:hypothetical protein